MIFRINNGTYEDSLVIEADTIEEIREKANYETTKRNWAGCWSECIEE